MFYNGFSVGFFRTGKAGGSTYYDYNLLACVILLVSFGLVMLYSTSAYTAKRNYGSDMTFFAKQAGLSAVCILGNAFLFPEWIIIGSLTGSLALSHF